MELRGGGGSPCGLIPRENITIQKQQLSVPFSYLQSKKPSVHFLVTCCIRRQTELRAWPGCGRVLRAREQEGERGLCEAELFYPTWSVALCSSTQVVAALSGSAFQGTREESAGHVGHVHPGKMWKFDLHCGMNSTRSKALELGTQHGGISGSGSSPDAELGVWLARSLPGTQDTSPTHAEATWSRADIVLFCLGREAQSWNLPLATGLAGGPLFTLSPPDPLSPAKPGTHFSLCILPDLRRTHFFTRWQVKKSVRAFVILEYLQHGENHRLQKEACLLFYPKCLFHWG